MKAKLSPKESFTLYGIGIAVAFGFFLLGLYWGSNATTPAPPQPVAGANVPRATVTQTKSRLDFHTPGLETAGKPETQTTPAGAESPAVDAAKPPIVTEVRQDPIDSPAPSATPPSDTEPRTVGDHFSIQVGALNTEEEARKVMIRLESRGYTGILDKPAGRDRFFRVRVGMYETREAAQRAEALLKGEGFLTFVKRIDAGGRTN